MRNAKCTFTIVHSSPHVFKMVIIVALRKLFVQRKKKGLGLYLSSDAVFFLRVARVWILEYPSCAAKAEMMRWVLVMLRLLMLLLLLLLSLLLSLHFLLLCLWRTHVSVLDHFHNIHSVVFSVS